jgi:hypothetical protein
MLKHKKLHNGFHVNFPKKILNIQLSTKNTTKYK